MNKKQNATVINNNHKNCKKKNREKTVTKHEPKKKNAYGEICNR